VIRAWLLAAVLLLAGGLVPAAAEDAPPADWQAAVSALLAKGDAAVAAYQPEHRIKAADALSGVYFDDFEPLEGPIGAVDPALKNQLEAQFGQLIGKIRQAQPQPMVAAAWAELRSRLAGLPERMGQSGGGFWSTFIQSLLILLREGFEAMLVVTALITYLRRSGATDKLRVVYHGVGWALAASLATAWAFAELIDVSGQGREVLEGGTMLLAALVLFYCSYWLFAKREAARWQRYVKEQIEQALSGGRLFALGFAAFLAVYREGAETVLFYQALAVGAHGQMIALWSGLAAAVLVLAAVYIAMQVLSLRLPLGLFFAATAGLLYYLALAFAGKGVVELQNGKALSITPLDGWPSIDWLGLFPTVEGMAAQSLLVLPLLLGLGWWAFRRRAVTPVKPT
jgi:high-affinity iron transporter